MPRILLGLAASLSLAFAPAPFPRPEVPDHRPEREKVQGTWERIRYIHEGKVFAEPVRVTVVIAGEQAIFGVGPGQTKWGLQLRPDSNPKTFTLTRLGTVLRGVYKLEGSTLTLCFRPDGKQQPDFDGAKSGVSLTFYKRVKR
jgi:uncharacterized protein (TIGR03067 family)